MDISGWDAIARCRICGLALLASFLRSRDWVVRRVEHVSFVDDRTVRRSVTVDYSCPSDSVVLENSPTGDIRILPLALMRAKSLTNFDFRDEAGRPLHLLGLRENQALTLAVIRAWALEALQVGFDDDVDFSDVDKLLVRAITGDQAEIQAAYSDLKHAERGSPMAALSEDVPFTDMLDRLATSFVIFRLDDAPPATRRLAKFAYDERLTLRYSSSGYIGHPDGEYPVRNAERGPSYPGGKRLSLGDLITGSYPRLAREGTGFVDRQRLAMMNRWDALKDHFRAWGAGIGWRPTVIRFPVPGAELATSFHVELSVPRDISLVKASILAGRPPVATPCHSTTRLDECAIGRPGPTRDLVRPEWGKSRTRPSFDVVGGGFSRVGLHVADVPYGSLSRAQVKVQPDTNGWWAGAVLACLLSTVAQLGAVVAAKHPGGVTEARHDIAATVLVTLAAGILAMVTQRDGHRMATRLLRWVRPLVLISTVSLVSASALFALHSERGHFLLELWIAFGISASVTCLVAGGWVRAKVRLRGDFEDESPWEHRWHPPRDPVNEPDHVNKAKEFDADDRPGFAYESAASWLGFHRPAIRVAGQERIREEFHWDDEFSELVDCRLHCALVRIRARLASPHGGNHQAGEHAL
jgi:hypothetical protein